MVEKVGVKGYMVLFVNMLETYCLRVADEMSGFNLTNLHRLLKTR